MLRVAAVDDSPIVREFLTSVLEAEPDVRLVAMGTNGAEAIEIARTHKPDVMVLDLEMPGMTGMDVLKALMPDTPLRVLIYTSHGGRSLAAFQALRLGALDLLNKPENLLEPESFERARTALLERVRAVALATLQVSALDPTVAPRNPPAEECPYRVLAIGATSGGTATLLPLLRALPSTMPTPVLLFPQINPAMVGGFAEWLNSEASIKVATPTDKMPLQPGTVYVTPPGRGFEVAEHRWSAVNGYAADPTAGGLDFSLTQLAEVYRSSLLAVLLGGIGIDGLDGLAAVRRQGGTVLILEPSTAYTPDLPAAAVRQGLASEVVPLARLGARVLEYCRIRRA